MWGNENAEQTGDSAGLQGTGRQVIGCVTVTLLRGGWRVKCQLYFFLFLYICFICGLFVYISVMHTDLSQ